MVGLVLLPKCLTVWGSFCKPTGTSKALLGWGLLHTATAESFSVVLRRVLHQKAGWNWTNGWQDIEVSVEKRLFCSWKPSTTDWISHLTPFILTQELTRSYCLLCWLDFGWCIWFYRLHRFNTFDKRVPLRASPWVVLLESRFHAYKLGDSSCQLATHC